MAVTNRAFKHATSLLTAIHHWLPTSAEEAVSAEILTEMLNRQGFDVTDAAVEPALWFLHETGSVEVHGKTMPRFTRREK